MDTSGKTVKRMLEEFSRSRKYLTPGVIMVVHPFGYDLKTNLMSIYYLLKGGLTKKKKRESYHFFNGQKDKKGLNYICSNCKIRGDNPL